MDEPEYEAAPYDATVTSQQATASIPAAQAGKY
jgi:hypothetical protein